MDGRFVVYEPTVRATGITGCVIGFVQRSEGSDPPLVGPLRVSSALE